MTEPTGIVEDRDAAARERALDPTRSILLEAPAGAGKTTVLTRRFLRLLCTVEEPEQILAITFTRKAAGEMRERVLRALRAQDEHSAGAMRELAAAVLARSRQRGWSLEEDAGRLRIQTIDALNRRLASELPLGARGAGDAQVMESPLRLYRRAARRALLDAQSDEHLRVDAERLFERLDNDFGRFERLLTEMLQVRGHWLAVLLGAGSGPGSGSGAGAGPGSGPAVPLSERGAELPARVEESLQALVAERLRRASVAIPAALIAEGAQLAAQAARRRSELGSASVPAHQPWRAWLEPPRVLDCLSLHHWQGLAQLALTAEGEWRRSLTKREGFPSKSEGSPSKSPGIALDDQALKALKARALDWIGDLARIGARERLCELACLPDPALSAEDSGALTSLARLLQLAASELAVVFAESRRVDFVEVAAAARQALAEEGAPSDLALEVGTDIRHILVDEFQDTSIEQVRLLETLTAGWERGDGRTLFAVGDPMQSIYQFREAEVGLFLRAATHGIGKLSLERLALTRNFRARPGLVAWLNEVFPRCFPAIDDPRSSAVQYRPCESGGNDESDGSAEPCGPGGPVYLHPTALCDRQAEARAVLELIRRLRAREPTASIAVLVAARSHAVPIVAALEAAGVAVAGVDLVPLGELPVVRDLEALARALDHFGDRTAWLAVLRAPWCGLRLVELSALLEGAPERTVWEAIHDERRVALLAADARARLERVRGVLAHALERRDRLDLASWVEATWLALGGPAACREEADIERAQAFFARLAKWSAEPAWSGPLELAERLEMLYAPAGARTFEAAFEAASEAVQIMTIHRAKGLEFDTVIVPGLGRKLRAGAEPLLRWLELPREPAGTDLLMAAIPPPWRRGEDRLTEYLKALAAQRAANERIRLLYVAATRARSQLHLFAEPPSSGADAATTARAGAPSEGTLLAALWPGIANPFREAVARIARPAAAEAVRSAADARSSLVRLAADWRMPPIAQQPRFESLTLELDDRSRDLQEGTGSALLDGEDVRLARAAARIVCDQLRRCARIGRLPASGTAALERALRERLNRLGLEGEELEEGTRRASEMFEAALADSRLQWIFSPRHSRIESPCRLSGPSGRRLISVMLDRTFVDESGVRWLIRFAPDEAIEHGWVERVVPLARALGPEPVRAGLYDPAGQQWRSLHP
ncbi:MAG: UvrD-helicase domain-containing protein [Steroidobacteraceae bacterium]